MAKQNLETPEATVAVIDNPFDKRFVNTKPFEFEKAVAECPKEFDERWAKEELLVCSVYDARFGKFVLQCFEKQFVNILLAEYLKYLGVSKDYMELAQKKYAKSPAEFLYRFTKNITIERAKEMEIGKDIIKKHSLAIAAQKDACLFSLQSIPLQNFGLHVGAIWYVPNVTAENATVFPEI